MSDQSDRNIVLFIFITAFIYMNYLRIKIDIQNDWENMKCNPMNLWTSSFFKDAKTANTNFNNCINKLSAGSIEAGLQAAYIKQQQAMNEIANQETKLNGYLTTITDAVNGPGGLVDQYNINEIKLNDLKEKQITYGTINETLKTNTYDNNLYKFTDNVQTIFNNIKQYLPTLRI